MSCHGHDTFISKTIQIFLMEMLLIVAYCVLACFRESKYSKQVDELWMVQF